MPTSQVSVILIANPFFSFLILASCCRAHPAAASLLDPELISRISGSFGASYYNIMLRLASVKTPGEINIADFCHFSVEESTGAPGASQLTK
jgi:hypothetical protein